jgi:hypothetical protein
MSPREKSSLAALLQLGLEGQKLGKRRVRIRLPLRARSLWRTCILATLTAPLSAITPAIHGPVPTRLAIATVITSPLPGLASGFIRIAARAVGSMRLTRMITASIAASFCVARGDCVP